MPLLQIMGVSGCLLSEQKSELIRRVTDALLSVGGEGLRPVTWVLVEDIPDSQWGVGGQSVSAKVLTDMAGERPPSR